MLNAEYLDKVKEEIVVLIPYAVSPEQLDRARSFVEIYAEDYFALGIIKDYYQTLPDAREEALIKISVLEEKEQVFLMLLSTADHHYFYVTNDEESLFLNEWDKGLDDKQLLNYFGYTDSKSFTDAHPDKEKCREYKPLERMDEDLCPSCGVRTGSMHTLGCPVELCPWCGGQLNHCNCRFEQLDVEELTDEIMLEKFAEKLETKGRVAYSSEQRPTFMAEEEDDDLKGPLLH
ncbi:MAG: hypothetical protein DSY80_00360 [Desulfocapsa sp.]|nr:MAG: hypothetical protein DSY80_00360 [Desulfocapsa sp.]